MLIAVALLLGADVSAAAAKPAALDPNKIVCKNINRTGSRLASDRVCMTRGEWDQAERAAQKEVQQLQARLGPCPPREVCGGD